MSFAWETLLPSLMHEFLRIHVQLWARHLLFEDAHMRSRVSFLRNAWVRAMSDLAVALENRRDLARRACVTFQFVVARWLGWKLPLPSTHKISSFKNLAYSAQNLPEGHPSPHVRARVNLCKKVAWKGGFTINLIKTSKYGSSFNQVI